jgi:HPt (histidine-containing phosphotransfer) domain-containing protein
MKHELARVLGLETAVEPQPVSSFDGVLLVDERLGVEIWGGMREVWVEGLVMFVQQLPAQREDIRNALAASDPLPATAAVHAMRGTASTLGLQALSHLLGNVETSLRRGDAALALRCAADLDPVIDRTLVALSPLLDELHQADDAAAGEPLLADEALALIDAMVDALRRGEAPSRQLERLRHVLGPGLKQPAWTQASQALDNFEFDRAALALADLRQWVVTQAGH